MELSINDASKDNIDFMRSAVATNACSVTRSLKLSNVEPG